MLYTPLFYGVLLPLIKCTLPDYQVIVAVCVCVCVKSNKRGGVIFVHCLLSEVYRLFIDK